MKSYHVNLGAGLDGLTVREHPRPEPGPGEALMRVRANSLSYRELMILRGAYPLPVKPDVVAVSDGAGEIVAIGPGVTRVRVGDRVAASIFPDWLDGRFRPEVAAQLGGSMDGMLTEYAVLPERALVQLPEHLSYEEGATLPCVGVTAWNALTGGRGVRPRETVLILGTGGVSLFALQFARSLGARVIATTSSPDRAARLRVLGADEVIDYRQTPDWPRAVRALTGGRGVDQVIEVAGTLRQSLQAVAFEGEIAFVGMLSDQGRASPVDPTQLFASAAVVRAVACGHRGRFLEMNRQIEAQRIQPIIDRVFPFDAAHDAYRYFQDARPFGKVVIRHP